LDADFRVGQCTVRPKRRIIECGAESIHIKPKAMAVLECLVMAGGEPVSRNDLFDKVWPGGEVTDDTLTKCIAELRKAFGDTARDSRVIETIPKLGFRLVEPVEPLGASSPSADHRQLPLDSSRGNRVLSLSLLALAFFLGILLTSLTARLWLTEAGINLLMKSAAAISPHELEREPGIAVLPFLNMSDDVDNEYFSDGMSAEVINALARTQHLRVIARNSSFRFKGRSTDVKEVGRQLGVTHVLEGSVRKWGEVIRLTAQLSDTSTGALLWSGVYQRELGDIFALQSEIAQSIVGEISVALGGDLARTTQSRAATQFMKHYPPSNLEAYDLYLRGVEMLTSHRPALIEQAPEYFDKAIELDSGYADAWAAKGYALAVLGAHYSGSGRIPATVYPAAIVAFKQALVIEPGHAFATGWLGLALMVNDFKWAEGMQLMQQSLAMNPNDARLMAAYGFYLDTLQLEGADEVLERAYRLDPFNFEAIVNRAVRLGRQGRRLEAASLIETSLIKDPDGYGPNYYSAMYNIALGRLDLAEERIRRARLVAKATDLNLDALQWVVDSRRGKGTLPLQELRERSRSEQLSGMVLWPGWRDEEIIEEYGIETSYIVEAFELAIEQRHPALRSALFREEPPLIPEEEWQRIREITGAAQFQASLEEVGNEYAEPVL
jgi:TolB-like protein/DNA-binding winged helix-turn-helix (wHTH) protein